MTLLTWLLVILLAVFVILGIVLVGAFLKLGRELRRVGDDTVSLVARLQRVSRIVQMVAPLTLLVRRAGKTLIERYYTKMSKRRRK